MIELELSLKVLNRSLDRLHHFNSSVSIDAKTVESDLTAGDYFMNIAISEPGTTRLVIPDMVGDLIWLRCAKNEHSSLYNPKSSETYSVILFGTENCHLEGKTTKGDSNTCRYEYHPSSDGFYSSGVLATKTFYFNNDNKFSNIVFGCDDAHKGDFKEGVEGVVGLGQGKLSLVSQLGEEAGKKFSYCLVKKSESSASKIIFGSDVTLYNDEIVYKAQVTRSPIHPHYFLQLEKISINKEEIKVQLNMAVNIQKSLTTLPAKIYEKLVTKFIAEAGARDISTETNPDYGNTCFLKREFQEIQELPKIIFHYRKAEDFNGVADFHVNPTTLFQTDGDYMCLTIAPDPDNGVSVLGNQAQVDKQMLFDLSSHSLNFASLDCNNFST